MDTNGRDGNLHFALLGLVAGRSEGTHGYRLKRELEALCDESARISFGRIYRVLESLQASAHLDCSNHVQEGRPNRKVYRITDKGVRTVSEWLSQTPPNEPFPVRDEIVIRLLVTDSTDVVQIAALLRQQRVAYMTRLRHAARRQVVLQKAGVNGEMPRLLASMAEGRVRAEIACLEQYERRVLRQSLPEGK